MENSIFNKKIEEAKSFFDNEHSATTNISLCEMKFALENMNPEMLLNLLHIAFYSGYRYGKEIPRSFEEILDEYNIDYDALSKGLGIERNELDKKISEETFTESELNYICSYVGIEDKEKTFGRK